MADEDQSAVAEAEREANVHFVPVVSLPEVSVQTHEEDEIPIFKMRAKLFRFDRENQEWKERGTGDIKFLQEKVKKSVRILMRREKTLKVCANHPVAPALKLLEHANSDRAWTYVSTDFSDGVAEGEYTEEIFAIRFANSENAQKFKTQFLEAQEINKKIAAGEEVALGVSIGEDEEQAAAAPAEAKPAADAEKPAAESAAPAAEADKAEKPAEDK
eukprot:CAMPEP_0114556614 /NCGR_PEP_ID=MMETSP0114-20121206/9384_1 /TAXON_ID=31324 /ORGANISM="Goniomonas sp, Strain m" /LENGTH=215 /DNA_ID=CAMNT_0001741833 /DNA_START=27 /DNA_END=674 /DNA_ORIENTATION=-